MIKICVPQNQLSPMQIALLSNVESNCISFIKGRINKSDCRNLSIAIKLFAVEPYKQNEKGHFYITHNASFSISNSFNFVNDLNAFIKNECDIESLLPIHSLHIDLDIKQREKTDADEKESKKADETPDFFPQKAKYTFSQIILPDEIRSEIMNTLKVIECKDLIYNKWGFSEVEPVPKGIINFYGAPGTGKTMCAHAVANYLKRNILSLNYSEIESKYVGEAAKNLQKAFDVAAKSDSVLFFDEADSFLGKRIQNVTQGSDQAINSLRSQMLILLEEFSGVVIFATNLVTNFDNAFESRILKHIHFELPNKEARAAIIEKMIPMKLPLESPFSKDNFLELSSLINGFSGREIKNAILDTLLSKASKEYTNIIFKMDDFIDSFKHKKEELERLKKEQQDEKKLKIMNALTKQVKEDSQSKTDETNSSEDELKTKKAIDVSIFTK